jgi:hypothetical protein
VQSGKKRARATAPRNPLSRVAAADLVFPGFVGRSSRR